MPKVWKKHIAAFTTHTSFHLNARHAISEYPNRLFCIVFSRVRSTAGVQKQRRARVNFIDKG
jgi:hypothetical protein